MEPEAAEQFIMQMKILVALGFAKALFAFIVMGFGVAMILQRRNAPGRVWPKALLLLALGYCIGVVRVSPMAAEDILPLANQTLATGLAALLVANAVLIWRNVFPRGNRRGAQEPQAHEPDRED